MNIILAGTGHRPDKLGGYSEDVRDRLFALAYDELKRIRPNVVISGMALGWDQALARAAQAHRIKLYAYVPFKGQEQKWPLASRLEYRQLLDQATLVCVVCEGDYAGWKMNRRNEAMVDASTHVLALWSGQPGGTANCVFYAKRQGRPLHNCWPKWVSGQQQAELDWEAA